MSLQIWLPLNGNLQQQGLSNVNATMMGTSITYSAGKIGQAATFPNNCNSCIHMPGPKLQTGSWAAWIKVNGAGSGTSQRLICEGRDTGSIGTNIWASKEGTTLYWRTHKIGGQTTISLNTWYHVALTFGNSIAKFYLNGTLLTTQSYTDNTDYAQSNDRLVLGKMAYSYTNTSNYFPFNGQLNDVRIYDHVLSAKEVEEISKGLVLHYKLDNITQPNLLSGNPNFINAWVQDGITLTQESDNSLKCVVTTNTKRIYNNVSNVWTTIGNTYTVSFLAKAQTNGTEVRASRSIADYAPTFILTTDWKYYSAQITITATSTSGTLSIQGVNNGDVFWLRNIKLEKGSIATHYLLPNDIIDIIYDSSGYNNNGTIVGSLETIIPGPRYSCATKMTNGQYIRVNNRPNACMPKDAITVNLWQYATSWSNPISCTEGGGWNFENNNGIRFPVYISGVGYKVAQSSITTASTLNAWHMLTGTMDKDNIKIYYDGEEVGTIANGSTNGIAYANNYIFIGAEAQGNNTSPANSPYAGNLSDIRIYATALTPEQIKELYNTSMTIDNNGNIHARELVE